MSEFSGLSAGDRVAIYSNRFSSSRYDIKTIDKVTPSGRIKIGNLEFNPDGSQRGRNTESFSAPFVELRLITPEIEQAIRVQKARYRLKEMKLNELSDEQAIALYAAYQQIVGGGE